MYNMNMPMQEVGSPYYSMEGFNGIDTAPNPKYLNEMRDTQTREKKPRVNREVIPQSNAPIMANNWNSSQQPPLNTYANIVNGSKNGSSFNVCFVTSENNQNDDSTVEIPIDVVRKGSIPFKHTLYGLFIGEKAPFDVVYQFAHDTWKDYGILDVFMNDKGSFFFKFDSEQGMVMVMEDSPWMIRNMPIFIRRWEPGLGLEKLRHDRVPIWVYFYDVPLELWTDNGLSYLASKLGVPIAVDTRTARMCENPSGCMAYARILIELSVETAWKEEVRVIIPKLNGHDKSVSTVRIEYAWLPPSYFVCKTFGHSDESCPRHLNSNTSPNGVQHVKCNVDDEGFIAESSKGGNIVKAASQDIGRSTATLNQSMPTTIKGLVAHINPSPSIHEREKRCVVEVEKEGAIQNRLIDLPEKMSGVNPGEDKKHGAGDEGAHINFTVRGQDGSEVCFRIKRSSKLMKLKNAYCHRMCVRLDDLGLLYDARRLSGEETPDELEMEDGDVIEAMIHQRGC